MDGEDDNDQIKIARVFKEVIDLRGQNLSSWDDLRALVQEAEADAGTSNIALWRLVFLQRNAFTQFMWVQKCISLRLLDISSNCIDRLPARSFWTPLANLEILLLHNNNIQSLASLQSFSAIPKLLAVSIHGNPVAARATCRHAIANSNSSIKLIDDYLVSDQELMEGKLHRTVGPKSSPSLMD